MLTLILQKETMQEMNLKKKFVQTNVLTVLNSGNCATMENLRKKISVRLVSNAKDYLKYISKPTFISQKVFNKIVAAIHGIKPVSVLNKPIYVGFTVLEVNKPLMYYFHYNFFKKKVDADLLFTDTDSLTYEIKSKDVYE